MIPNLQSQGNRTYVLLIEHDPELRKIMDLSLQQAGFIIVAFSRYANALQIMKQNPPDIFVVDFELRDGDPGKLITAYRQNPNFPAGSVVVTTTERLEDEWRRTHQPDAVVYKPFDMRYLIRLIGMFTQEKVH
jgi:CheY-like chemotaxis protein